MPRARARRAERCSRAPYPRAAGALADELELGRAARRAQARVERERELDARGAAAHDRDARPRGQRRDPRVELGDQPRDRARGQRVLAHARQIEAAHGRAHVEARHVVGERRAALELDPARAASIETARAITTRARARRASGTTSIASSCAA